MRQMAVGDWGGFPFGQLRIRLRHLALAAGADADDARLTSGFALVDVCSRCSSPGQATGWGLVWMILMGLAGSARCVTFFWPGITASPCST